LSQMRERSTISEKRVPWRARAASINSPTVAAATFSLATPAASRAEANRRRTAEAGRRVEVGATSLKGYLLRLRAPTIPLACRPVSGLLVVRHAQSIWNAEGRWQGQADPPLSPLGEMQSRAAAERLDGTGRFDLVVSSDLTRARRTAELMVAVLGQTGPHRVEPLLREYDVGEWSGLTRAEIEERWPGVLTRFDQRQVRSPPGGEDRDAFDARVRRAGAAVASVAARHGAARVLVVAHGGVVRSLARAVGLLDQRIGFLAGYRGEHEAGGLVPKTPIDLLDGSGPPDGHRADIPSPM
jgi:glucosyl-3-phosphoglycerate phosphatase